MLCRPRHSSDTTIGHPHADHYEPHLRCLSQCLCTSSNTRLCEHGALRAHSPLGGWEVGGHLTSSPLLSTAGTNLSRMSNDANSNTSAASDLICATHGSVALWYCGGRPSSYM